MSQPSYSQLNIQPHTYQSPTPTNAAAATYHRNLQLWSTATTPAARTPHAASRAQNRPSRSARATPQPQQPTAQLQLHPQSYSYMNSPLYANPAAPKPPLPQHLYSVLKNTREQARWSTYASRMRTGCTLLMQPIVTPTAVNTIAQQIQMPQTLSIVGRPSRRAAAARNVSYIDQGSSAEDEPDDDDGGADAGEKMDSDDEEFLAGGGARTSVRQSRAGSRMGSMPRTQPVDEITQSYLGQEPPERLLKWTYVPDGGHGHGARELHGEVNLGTGLLPPFKTSLIPISLSLNTPKHRIRDSFVWNIHENIIHPHGFARVMCQDLELDESYVDLIAAQIETQIEEHLEVASADIENEAFQTEMTTGERPECRVILSINVHIPPSQHLLDHIEWDLLSTLTPEEFATTFCAEVGLGGESVPLIAHALHEELLKHKKDAIEWGVLTTDGSSGQIRDRTGLGLSSASAWTKGGPGPRVLKSIWRDYAEAEEFQTRLQDMTEEERERRELEGERNARRLRRETSKFQSSGRSMRRR